MQELWKMTLLPQELLQMILACWLSFYKTFDRWLSFHKSTYKFPFTRTLIDDFSSTRKSLRKELLTCNFPSIRLFYMYFLSRDLWHVDFSQLEYIDVSSTKLLTDKFPSARRPLNDVFLSQVFWQMTFLPQEHFADDFTLTRFFDRWLIFC